MGAFFQASARLFRAAPWKVLPDDAGVFSATVEAYGLRGAVLSVIGKLGQNLGFVLFPTRQAFEAYLDAAEAVEQGDDSATIPSHFALNFERGAAISSGLRKEVAARNWEVASPNAYPWLATIAGDFVARPPSTEELALAGALCVALAQWFEKEPAALRDAWKPGKAIVRKFAIPTGAGPVEVELAAPHSAGRAATAGGPRPRAANTGARPATPPPQAQPGRAKPLKPASKAGKKGT
jgi:hypothetical protein